MVNEVAKTDDFNEEITGDSSPLERSLQTLDQIIKDLINGDNDSRTKLLSNVKCEELINADNKTLLQNLIVKIIYDVDLLGLVIQKAPTFLNIKTLNGSNALHLAAGYGKLDIVKFLTDNYPVFLTERTLSGFNALNIALGNQKLNVAKLLIEIKPDFLIEKVPNKLSGLHHAAAMGLEDIMKFVIDKHPDFLYEKTTFGLNVVHLAVLHGKFEIVKLIVDIHPGFLNSKISKTSDLVEYNYTPLHLAAEGGHLETVKYLLEKGADVEAKSNLLYTPLFSALNKINYNSVAIIELLIKYGAKTNAKDLNDNTLLHKIVALGNQSLGEDGEEEVYLFKIIEILLSQKVSLYTQNKAGVTSLYEMATESLLFDECLSCNGRISSKDIRNVIDVIKKTMPSFEYFDNLNKVLENKLVAEKFSTVIFQRNDLRAAKEILDNRKIEEDIMVNHTLLIAGLDYSSSHHYSNKIYNNIISFLLENNFFPNLIKELYITLIFSNLSLDFADYFEERIDSGKHTSRFNDISSGCLFKILSYLQPLEYLNFLSVDDTAVKISRDYRDHYYKLKSLKSNTQIMDMLELSIQKIESFVQEDQEKLSLLGNSANEETYNLDMVD